MKSLTKIISLFFLLLNIQVFGQDVTLTTFIDGVSNVCGEELPIDIEIENNSGSTISSGTVSIQLPPGVYYSTGTAVGMTESDVSDLNAPVFSISNLTDVVSYFEYNVNSGCDVVDYIRSNFEDPENGFVIAETTLDYTIGGTSFSYEEPNGSESISIIYTELQLDVDEDDQQVDEVALFDVVDRKFSVKNTGLGSTDKVIITLERVAELDQEQLFLLNSSDVVVAELTPSSSSSENLIFELSGTQFPNTGTSQEQFELNDVLRFSWSVRVVGCEEAIRARISANWGCGAEYCNVSTETFFEPVIGVDLVGGPEILSFYEKTQMGSFCGDIPLQVSATYTNNGVGSVDPLVNALYNVKIRTTDNLSTIDIGSATIDGSTIANDGIIDLADLLTSDPDGAGGLSDLDGDSFYDDLDEGATIMVFTFEAPGVGDINVSQTNSDYFYTLELLGQNYCEVNSPIVSSEDFGYIYKGDSSENYAGGSSAGYNIPDNIVEDGSEFEAIIPINRTLTLDNISCGSPSLSTDFVLPSGIVATKLEVSSNSGEYTEVSFTTSGQTVTASSSATISNGVINVPLTYRITLSKEVCDIESSFSTLTLRTYVNCESRCSTSYLLATRNYLYKITGCPSCDDGIMNGDEEGIDCGGSCDNECEPGDGGGGGGSCAFTSTEVKLTRMTLGWVPDVSDLRIAGSNPGTSSYYYNPYSYQELYIDKSVPKVSVDDPYIRLDRSYPGDTLKLEVNLIANRNILLDEVQQITFTHSNFQDWDGSVTRTFRMFRLEEFTHIVIDGVEYPFTDEQSPVIGDLSSETVISANLNLAANGIPRTITSGQEISIIGKMLVLDEVNPATSLRYKYANVHNQMVQDLKAVLDGASSCEDIFNDFEYIIPQVWPFVTSVSQTVCGYENNLYRISSATYHRGYNDYRDFPNEFRPLFYIKSFQGAFPPELSKYDVIIQSEDILTDRVAITNEINTDGENYHLAEAIFDPSKVLVYEAYNYKSAIGNAISYSMEPICNEEEFSLSSTLGDIDVQAEVGLYAYAEKLESHFLYNFTGSPYHTPKIYSSINRKLIVSGEFVKEAEDEPVTYPLQVCTEGYSNQPNNYFASIELPEGTNLKILSVTDELGNPLEGEYFGTGVDAVQHPEGRNYLVHLGSMARNTCKQLFIETDYFDCNEEALEEFQLITGFSCSGGYPEVTSTTTTVKDLVRCDIPLQETTLSQRIRLSNLQIVVDKLGDRRQPLCEPSEFEVLVASTRYADVSDLKITANLPDGIVYDNTYTAQYLYPAIGGTGAFEDIPAGAFFSNGSTIGWDMTQVIGDILPGSYSPNNSVKVKFSLSSTCDIDPGLPIQFFVDGTTNCGGPAQLKEQRKIRISDFIFDELVMTMSAAEFTECDPIQTVSITLDNSEDNATLSDVLRMELPAGLSYNSVTPESALAAPTITAQGSGTLLEFSLPESYVDPNSSRTLGVNLELTNLTDLSALYSISASTIQNGEALCVADDTSCPLIATTSQAELQIEADLDFDLPEIVVDKGLYCIGETINSTFSLNLSDTHVSYQLFHNGVGGTVYSVGTNLNPTLGATDVGEYYVEVETNKGCFYQSSSIAIRFDEGILEVTGGDDQWICGQSATLSASANEYEEDLSWQWSKVSGPGNVGFTSSNNTTTISIQEGAFGDYVIQVEASNNCQTDTDLITVSYQDFSISGTTECSGISYTLSTTISPDPTGFTYKWYRLDGPAVSNNSANLVTSNVSGGGYRVEATKDECVLTFDFPLNNFPTPSITSTGNLTPCSSEGISVLLESSQSDEYESYEWYRQGDTDPLDNADLPHLFTAVAEGSYYVLVTNEFGCTRQSNVVTTNFYSELVEASTEDQIVCDGSTTLTGGGSYQSGYWEVITLPDGVASTDVIYDPSVDVPSPNVQLPAVGEYEFRWNVVGECAENTASAISNVIFDDRFYANVHIEMVTGSYDEVSSTATVCSGSEFTLEGQMLHPEELEITANLDYEWFLEGASVHSGKVYSTTTLGEYTVVITGLGCERSATINVVPNDFIDDISIVIAEGDHQFCPGETRTLSVPEGYLSYQWQNSSGAIAGQTSNTYVASNPGTYTVAITDVTGCTDITASVELIYYDAVTISISNVKGITCPGANDGQAEIRISGGGGGPISYEIITPAETRSLTISENVIESFDDFGLGRHTVVAIHPVTGCTTSRSFNIIDGSPIMTNQYTSSLSCEPSFATGEAALVSFMVSRIYPQEPADGTYDYVLEGSAGAELTGSGIFGEQVTTTSSISYDQSYYLRLVADGVTTDNNCEKSFPIVFNRATISMMPDPCRLIPAGQNCDPSDFFDTENGLITYRVCGPGEEAKIALSTTLSVTDITPGETDLFNYDIYKDEMLVNSLASESGELVLSLSAGNYRVEATSANDVYANCSASESFSVVETNIVASISKVDVSCPDGENGSLRALASGGVAPYRYYWYDLDNASNTPISTLSSVRGLPAGNYRLQVFDQFCTNPYEEDVEIIQPDPLGEIAFTQLPDENSCEVVAKLSPAGGTPPYTFQWIQIETITPYKLGLDENGKIAMIEDVENAHEEEQVRFAERGIYAVDGVAETMTTTEYIEPGEYMIRVIDKNGCEITGDRQVIEQPAVPREYGLTFKWMSAPELEEPKPDITISSASIASSSMGQTIQDQAARCVEESKAVVGGIFDLYCKTVENIVDTVKLRYEINQYHYTLYYYDRAGNLTRTVPPKGVDFLTPADFPSGIMSRSKANEHSLITTYNYNNWGQLSRQNSPDGGTTNFAYNNLGQLRFSQNARQLGEGSLGTFSYTKYDLLGRVREVGQADLGGTFEGQSVASFSDLQNEDLLDIDKEHKVVEEQYPLAANNLTQVTSTVYSDLSAETYYGEEQTHLRNRVSYNTSTNKDGSVAATHYSYDPHGNVKWLIQDIPDLNKNYIGYDYDLISGNVKEVAFNQGTTTPFFHRYSYDEDSRIQSVETSSNGFIWEQDADYEYFEHGPLKRTVLGKDQVQGIDYTYTVHGWLKGVNHSSLSASLDPGSDAGPGSKVAKDAFGMVLGYYSGDFENTGSPLDAGAGYMLNANPGGDLYNGNISTWASQSASPQALTYDGLIGYQYQYDELNRIKTSAFTNYEAGSWIGQADFATNYSYDPNGNLLTLQRKAYGEDESERAMDELSYFYGTENNQLQYVDDAVIGSSWESDVEDQEAGNYAYDAIGNLIKDEQEGIANIDWTVYGKVNSITHENGDVVQFRYDAAGKRISKKSTKSAGGYKETFYVRDASGNIMGVYEDDGEHIQIREVPIYGSVRLGQYRPSIQLVDEVSGEKELVAYTGYSYLINEPTDAVVLGPGFTITPGDEFYAGANVDDIPPSALAAPAAADATHVRVMGRKQYELKDHLGNVRVVVSDRKFAARSGVTLSNYESELLHVAQYYAFGMEMPGLNYNSRNYRYGFNGKEKDQEGEWGSVTNYDYGFRIYNPGIAKFLSVDPLTRDYPWYTPYQFAGNAPIMAIDLDGLEPFFFMRAIAGEYGETTQEIAWGIAEGSEMLADQAMSYTKLETWKNMAKESLVIFVTYVVTDGAPNPQDRINALESNGITVLGPEEYAAIYNDMKLWGPREWSRTATVTAGSLGMAYITRKLSVRLPKIKDDPFISLNGFGGGNKWLVYSREKIGKLYIGKAKNKLTNRYTQKIIDESGAGVLIDNIPDNGTALGVERLILDKYGGGAKSDFNSNINNPTVKTDYIDQGKAFLDENYAGWDSYDTIEEFSKAINN